MSSQTDPAQLDILDQAIETVRLSPIPDAPSPEFFLTICQLGQNQSAVTVLQKKRQRIFLQYACFFSIAMIAVAVLLVLALGGQNTAMAFNKAVELVNRAEAVRYRVHMESAMSDQWDEVTIQGKQVRVDNLGLSKMSWIIDWEQSGMIILNPVNKAYQTIDLAARTGAMAPFDALALNIREQLGQLVQQKPVYQEREVLEGKNTLRYAITNTPSLGMTGNWLIWLDAQSHYPVKLSVRSTTSNTSFTREYSNFDWHPQIPPKLFKFEPPADYHEETIFFTIPPLVPFQKKK